MSPRRQDLSSAGTDQDVAGASPAGAGARRQNVPLASAPDAGAYHEPDAVGAIPLLRRITTLLLGRPRQPDGPVEGLQILPHGRRFAFDSFRMESNPKRILVIGADPGCDIVIDDDTVSGLHCLIERHDDRVLVHDCKSKNGTRINGVSMQEGELTPGTLLTLGRVSLVACGPDPHLRRVTLPAASLDEFLHVAVEAYGSLRSAAEALGLPYSTLRGWLKNKKGTGGNGAGPR